MTTTLLPPNARIFVAGHRGLAGSAIAAELAGAGHEVITRTRERLDLRDAEATGAFLRQVRPDAVVLAAARVGGIMANAGQPVPFLEDNLRIQLSVIAGAHAADVDRLLFLGSSCIYPREAPQPIPEEALLTGPLEPTNEPYALAKIAGISQVRSYRRQFGRSYIAAMPTNLYGPRDNFDPETAHVLPALIRRFDEARRADRAEVTLWGSGRPRREFLHSADLARACRLLLESYDGELALNVGCGEDLSIAELADRIASVVGYEGRIAWDTSRPDGTPRKLLDVSRLRALGFAPSIPLPEGLADTHAWWRAQRAA
ncbi:NAD-dependent epimerase/dehydratase family protein [Streptomyces sp. 3MP-14]|uniref:GDP-L-fucose synthase n=1 Tax=Streptomyces mimosae TaxID=2586635 RepID=A0A5N6AJX0_9ACTN|nr:MULTISPECIES: GDP-L-fucose synthase [Streptomyces]KAB8168515.1 NAD-dependent epimerase/dehydratase family protein [Streptomyces mimosae]KAB8178204.1 NAD-dependent epimerase/dehydratase family protein [Streptomyces sp. 3MP-14]